MTISDSVPKRTLKIRISSKKVELVLDSVSRDISQKPYVKDDSVRNISINGDKESVTQISQKTVSHSSESLKRNGGNCGPPGAVDFVMNKRQKIDHSLKQECGRILESIIKHPASVGFLEPVDPVKLNIPDYFSVISKPMDLGTVRSKLLDNMYSSVEEFKADVKLTFSNAILYNPPDNFFNKAAKRLESMFNTKWKYLEARLKDDSTKCRDGISLSFRERKMAANRHLSPRRSPAEGRLYPKVSFAEKKTMTKEHGKEIRGKTTKKVEPAGKSLNSTCSERVFRKDTGGGNRSTCVPFKTISSLSIVATKCHSCGNLKCQCCGHNDYAQASSKVLISSERSLAKDCGASKMVNERENGIVPNTCKSDPESDGAVSALDEESIYVSPPPSGLSTSATSADGWTPAIDLQLSPKRALRAAMLKSRFADTIFKAKRKTLLVHEEKVDPVKMQQEREKLERQQKEEKARIEAQLRAAEVAISQKAKEREREREAARLAMQKMEQTVVIDDNMKFLKELDMLRLSVPDKSEVFCEASQDGRFGNILERLGLFIKDDEMDVEYAEAEPEPVVQDMEDGEICS